MLSLDGYLRRIGLGDRSGTVADGAWLRAVHRAHAISIPFENLDPLRGVPASLEPAALERKLVIERRGGFCFEHNTLLGAALEQLGYEVAPMLARVGDREGAAVYFRGGDRDGDGESRPLSHLVLRVRDRDGAVWHADAGFGAGERGGTLLEPIPLGPGGEYEQSGWRYRVQEHGDQLVLMALSSDGEWSDMYSFVPEPVPAIDVEVSNWFASTHPASPFIRHLVVAAQGGASRTMLRDTHGTLTLRTQTPTEHTVVEVDHGDLPRLLADRFGLLGWRLGADGRPVPETGGG
jgi:N-hydroxyarylamine O-acetyltransferase